MWRNVIFFKSGIVANMSLRDESSQNESSCTEYICELSLKDFFEKSGEQKILYQQRDEKRRCTDRDVAF